jgi:hypothetical protein
MIQSIVTAVSIVATAAKNVTQPVPSLNDPHFSLEKLYIPESSPIIKSFCRLDGWDWMRRDIGFGSAVVRSGPFLSLVEWSEVVVVVVALLAVVRRVRRGELRIWKEDALWWHCRKRRSARVKSCFGVMLLLGSVFLCDGCFYFCQ